LTAKEFKDLVNIKTSDKSLAGVVAWGHGTKDELLLNANVTNKDEAEAYLLSYDSWHVSVGRQLGQNVGHRPWGWRNIFSPQTPWAHGEGHLWRKNVQ
jgi:hypothetical protein